MVLQHEGRLMLCGSEKPGLFPKEWEINSDIVFTSAIQNFAAAKIGSAPRYLDKALP
jgi:hypothetical protein